MASFIWMALQESEGGSGVMGIAVLVVIFAIVIAMIAAMWTVFTKAGEPGWACLVPLYNLVVMCRIGGKPWWWMLLMFIPIVSLVIMIILCIAIAKNFGKGAGFGIGLAFLGFIFFPILAWGDATYSPAA